MTDFNTLLDPLAEIAREAGDAILAVYERDDLGVETKDDKSPITEADMACLLYTSDAADE